MATDKKVEVVEKKDRATLNPFEKGVSYVDFLDSLGDKNIDEELSLTCSKEQISWLKLELEIFNKQ